MFAKLSKYWLPAICFLAACWLIGDQAAMACPTCQDAVAQNDPTSSGMVAGFFWSILFMLSMPVLILTGLSTYFYFLVLQARKQQAATVGASVSAENVERDLVETR